MLVSLQATASATLADAVYKHDSLGLYRDFMSLCVKQINIQCEILLLLKTPLPTAAHHSVTAALAASGTGSQRSSS